MTESNIYYDEDANLSVLDDRTVAVIGYGNQGRAQALNMRDSGVDVIVGNRSDEYRERATGDGFDALPIDEAAARGDVVCLLIPDEVAPEVYESNVKPQLTEGDTLYFSHGYNVTFDLIRPPNGVNVILVAPRMSGPAVRSRYESGDGFPSIVAVDTDATGDAMAVTLALAEAIGSTWAGAVEGTFDMETTTDLLSEQALFPMMLNAMLAKYEVELALGIPPEIILTELYLSHEMAEVFEEMAERGFLGQLGFHSRTSQYGQLSRFDTFDREPMREFVEEQLRGLQNGSFVREWSAEQSLDRPGLKQLYQKYESHEFFENERQTMENLGLGENSD